MRHTKLKALGAAAYGRCDAFDGLRGGLITDLRNCDFDVEHDLPHCQNGVDRDDCYTSAEREAIGKIYGGPGEDLYPGYIKGGEWIDVGANQMAGGRMLV